MAASAAERLFDVYIGGVHVNFTDKQLRTALFSKMYLGHCSDMRHRTIQELYEYCAAHPYETVFVMRFKKIKQHLPFIQDLIDDAKRLRLLTLKRAY
jgi:hypothetical protein